MRKLLSIFIILFITLNLNASQELDNYYSCITTDNSNNIYVIQKNSKNNDNIIKINYIENSKEIWDLKNLNINDFELIRIRSNSDNQIVILIKDKSKYYISIFDKTGKLHKKWDLGSAAKSYKALITIDKKDRVIFDNIIEDRKYTNKITVFDKQGQIETHFLNNYKINGRTADIMAYDINNIYVIYGGIDYVTLYLYTPEQEKELGLANFSQEIIPFNNDGMLARNPAWLEMYSKDGKKLNKLSWSPSVRIISIAVDKNNNVFYTNINKIVQLQINLEKEYEVVKEWD